MTQTVLLGDLINIRSGKSRPKARGNYPVYGGNGIFDSAPTANMNEAAIVVGRVGAYCGSVYIEKQPFWLSDNALGVTVKDGVNLDFIYYLLKSIDLNKKSVGGAQPLLTQGILNDISVLAPGIESQKKIADILGTIDEKIELNRKMNETLEQMGQALFRHYFIDNPEVEKWEDGMISDLVTIYSGYAFKRTDFDPEGKYGLVTIKNVQDGSFVADCSGHLSQVPPKIPDYVYLKTGDILLSLTGNVGRVCIVNGRNLLLNQRVAKLADMDGKHSFSYFLFRQQNFKDKLISMSRGTAQLNLSPVETKNIRMKIPPGETLNNFYERAEPLFENITANYEQIQTLTTLRDTLLPRLINGKVKV